VIVILTVFLMGEKFFRFFAGYVTNIISLSHVDHVVPDVVAEPLTAVS